MESTATRFDVEKIRGDFPILSRLIVCKPLAYLDNAATSQKPQAVIDAVRRYYEDINANIHRGVHHLSVQATEAYELARDKVRDFLGAADRAEIVFTRGTTESINLVAQAFLRPRINEGDEILITHIEHHSNIVPWQILCTTVSNPPPLPLLFASPSPPPPPPLSSNSLSVSFFFALAIFPAMILC